ncbi:MAG: hypothetical protein WA142_08555 [Rugosibacter sp.]
MIIPAENHPPDQTRQAATSGRSERDRHRPARRHAGDGETVLANAEAEKKLNRPKSPANQVCAACHKKESIV